MRAIYIHQQSEERRKGFQDGLDTTNHIMVLHLKILERIRRLEMRVKAVELQKSRESGTGDDVRAHVDGKSITCRGKPLQRRASI